MVSIRFLGKCAHKMVPQPVETRQTCVRDCALNYADTAVDGAWGNGVLLWPLRVWDARHSYAQLMRAFVMKERCLLWLCVLVTC